MANEGKASGTGHKQKKKERNNNDSNNKKKKKRATTLEQQHSAVVTSWIKPCLRAGSKSRETFFLASSMSFDRLIETDRAKCRSNAAARSP